MREDAATKLRGLLVQDIKMTPTDWLVDFVIAAGAFGFGILQFSLSDNYFIPDDFTRMMLGIKSVTPSSYAIVATLLTCVPLIVRRKLPWVAFLLSLVMWGAFEWSRIVVSLSLVGSLIALFTLSYERPRSQSFTAGIVALLAVLLDPISVNAPRIVTLSLIQNVAIIVAVTFAGYALYSREQYVESIKDRSIELERLRKSEAERAISVARAERNEALKRVEEQRVQIARELHDITAHSLSAISIQAAVAERLIEEDPDKACEAIRSIRATSKESLDEIRAMVGVLRSEDSNESRAEKSPTQGTDDLHALVDYLKSAGINCELNKEDYVRKRVSAVVDIALARILREAATNVVKHANASKVSIRLFTDGDSAFLSIEDDGSGAGLSNSLKSSEEFLRYRSELSQNNDSSGGNGIIGMYERVALLGGKMSVGDLPDGGLKLDIEVPLSGLGE